MAYLAEHAPAGTRIGLAGRSLDKLQAARLALGAAARDWPLLVADTSDPAALDALADFATADLTVNGFPGRSAVGLWKRLRGPDR